MFNGPITKRHIRDSETHKYAAYQLAPRYYQEEAQRMKSAMQDLIIIGGGVNVQRIASKALLKN